MTPEPNKQNETGQISLSTQDGVAEPAGTSTDIDLNAGQRLAELAKLFGEQPTRPTADNPGPLCGLKDIHIYPGPPPNF